MQKKKSVVLFVLIFSILLISLVSAGWFGDLWGRVTGKVVSNSTNSWCDGADTDKDGDVDGTDSAKIGLNWNPSGVPPCNATTSWCDGADTDKDGDVDGADSAKIGLNWNPGGTPEPCVGEEEEPEVNCTDSDDGLDYYVKGYLTNHLNVTFEDYCLNSFNLIERHCESENLNNFTVQYNCPNGCQNGVCLNETVPPVANATCTDSDGACLNEVIVPPVENVTCTDSDGGLNYRVKGDTTGYEMSCVNYKTLSDHCGVEGPNIGKLYEYYCGPEGQIEECGGSKIQVNQVVYDCPNGCQDGECIGSSASCTDLVESPASLTIDETVWELVYNESWRDSSYGHHYMYYVRSNDFSYGSVRINVDQFFDDSNKRTMEEHLEWSVGNGLCEQRAFYINEEEQWAYVCKDLWMLSQNSRSISVVDGEERYTVFWISEDKLFEIYVSSYDFSGDYCYSYEDCREREEERHRDKQRDLISVFEKLIDNEAEYVGGFYMRWEAENFAGHFLESCASDIEERDGYVGPWRCKVEPVICPPHGSQTMVCTRYNGVLEEDETREEVDECSPGICSGCYVPRWFESKSNNKCIPYGFRFEHQTGWSIEEVFVSDRDEESLTVEESEELGAEVSLTVHDHDSALLVLEVAMGEYVNVSLREGVEYDWDEIMGDSNNNLQFTLFVDEIYYDVGNYGQSYIKVTFVAEGYEKRERSETINAYCDYDGRIYEQRVKDQDGNWAGCQNNYECESNLCSGESCVEINDMIENAGTFKSLGVRILCGFANLFGIEEYENCINNYLG